MRNEYNLLTKTPNNPIKWTERKHAFFPNKPSKWSIQLHEKLFNIIYTDQNN